MPPSPSRFDLQNRFLLDHYDTVVPNLLAPSPTPSSIWVTPPSRDPRFNAFFINNSLRFMLAPRPSRLSVLRVDKGVFEVTVSCHNIANVLVIHGALRIASVKLFFHPSLAVAQLAFRRLPPLVQTVATAASARYSPSTTAFTAIDPQTGPTHAPSATETIQLGTVPQNLLIVPALPFPPHAILPASAQAAPGPVPPQATDAAPGLFPGQTAQAAHAQPFTAQPPRSYLQAALTPPSPSLIFSKP